MKTTLLGASMTPRDSGTQASSHATPDSTDRNNAMPARDGHFLGGYWIAAVVVIILFTGYHRHRRSAPDR